MLGVYVGGKSGAHLNPAVTLANCVFRKFSWRKLPIYAIAQTLGAFAASGVVYANYKVSESVLSKRDRDINTIQSAIDVFEGGAGIRTVPGYSTTATAGIFCTYPQQFMTRTGMFFSEFIASAILMFCIYALADDGNIGAGNLLPLGLFFIIFGIGACFGWETGYAINLARDFGPRLMSYALGYGSEVWKAGGYYFWVSCLELQWSDFYSPELLLIASLCRSQWSLPSLAACSVASFTTFSSSLARARSTRLGWA